ncbi:MAG: hypothetical protein AAGA17_01470 [Actinomycetota bacterium]
MSAFLRSVTVVVVLVVAACSDGADARSSPSAEAVAANRAVLAQVPMLDGEPLLADDTVGPPGGVGAMSSVVHEAPPGMTPEQLGDRFVSALEGWTVICRVDRQFRTALDLRRGDAWLNVALGRGEIDGVSRPLISVAVNALDGGTIEFDVVSRQVCD